MVFRFICKWSGDSMHGEINPLSAHPVLYNTQVLTVLYNRTIPGSSDVTKSRLVSKKLLSGIAFAHQSTCHVRIAAPIIVREDPRWPWSWKMIWQCEIPPARPTIIINYLKKAPAARFFYCVKVGATNDRRTNTGNMSRILGVWHLRATVQSSRCHI